MAAVGFGCEQRMGEGEGMTWGFIGRSVSARRKESGDIWAGLATCHMWATAVAFHAGSANGGRRRRESIGKRKETLGKKKGKKGMVLTGGPASQRRRKWLAARLAGGASVQ